MKSFEDALREQIKFYSHIEPARRCSREMLLKQAKCASIEKRSEADSLLPKLSIKPQMKPM